MNVGFQSCAATGEKIKNETPVETYCSTFFKFVIKSILSFFLFPFLTMFKRKMCKTKLWTKVHKIQKKIMNFPACMYKSKKNP